MSTDLKKRFTILGIVILLGLIFLYPTIKAVIKGLSGSTVTSGEMLGEGWISKPIALGLDLSGGVHLVYEVQVAEAVKSHLQSLTMGVRDQLRDNKIALKKARVNEAGEVELTLLSERNVERVEEIIRSDFATLTTRGRRSEEGSTVLVYGINDQRAEEIKRRAVVQAVETLRNRVDQFGVTEPLIQQVAETRIMLQMPGVKDIDAVKRIVGKVAKLEFRFLPERVGDAGTVRLKNRAGEQVIVEDLVQMTGDAVDDARMDYDPTGIVEVALTLTPEGGKRFAKVSGDNGGRQLAIILDNVVYSHPEIKDRISGGRASITGGFSPQEAAELATVLRSGALPAPLVVMEENVVGPTLGAESIRAGIMAILIGFAGIFIFMFLYYRKSGLLACVTLALNLVLLVAVLAAFGATLTLPGLAGLALTIGMAVDANVIIFERIREELRVGASRDASVEAGFHKAFSAILDSNITTFISGLILYYFGTGPIRGFAVTLCIGIATTVFCATFVSRLLFDSWPRRGRAKALSI